MTEPLRLGFAVKVMSRPGVKSHDTRRWRNDPHLRVSLQHLSRVFDVLEEHRIRMYRMSSDLAPYATHPDMPQFHGMVRESRSELREIGQRAKTSDVRLSFHPSQFIVINSPDPELVKKSAWDLRSQAEMLDLMECGPEAVLVLHVGGLYDDRAGGRRRFVDNWRRLPEPVKRRLVLEHDDLRYGPADVLAIHDEIGIRLVFDYQHFWCLNPERLPLVPTVKRMVETWSPDVRPKIHFSTPRTELREVKRVRKGTRSKETVYLPPVWTGHADYVNPFEFVSFLRTVRELVFDVMLEVKAKDLALVRLRADLGRYAPDVAGRFGLRPEDEAAAETDEPVPAAALDTA